MSRVLVTGGSGFLGKRLVHSLITHNHHVRVLTRSAAAARQALPEDVELVEGDVADRMTCERAVSGTELIFHLAAAYQEPGLAWARYREVNVQGTYNLLAGAAAARVARFVHCSTVGVQGHISAPPAKESDPYNPGDRYQETKAEAEQLALAFNADHALEVTVARPTAIYGPGDMRLLKLFRLIQKRRFVTLGRGEVFYHMIYVDDLVRGMRMLADHPRAAGEVFTLGGGQYCTLNELTEAVAGVLHVPPPTLHLPAWPFQLLGSVLERVCIPLGIAPPLYRRRVDFFTKSRAFSVEKAKRVLGFEAAVPLEAGLRSTMCWYRRASYLMPEPLRRTDSYLR